MYAWIGLSLRRLGTDGDCKFKRKSCTQGLQPAAIRQSPLPFAEHGIPLR